MADASRRVAGERGVMKSNISTITRQLSVPVVAMMSAAFAAGAVSGWIDYLHRSPVRMPFVAGSSAWWQQLAVALITCVVFTYAQWRHRRRFGRRSGRLWMLAPLGKPAAQRLARAAGIGRGPSSPVRALIALLPAALIAYCFFRAGVQVTGGLDPNFTVNAWGGPSYAGAMACHYLDLFLMTAAAAWLLNQILPGRDRATSLVAA
jgi:hypothetical protein